VGRTAAWIEVGRTGAANGESLNAVGVEGRGELGMQQGIEAGSETGMKNGEVEAK
jgi:hypothetical protein